MKEKGVSPIIVIAIVIIIAAVGVGSYFILKGRGAGLGSLSIYTGSQSWDVPSEYRENLPAGVEVAGYTVSGASVQAVLDWYRGQMTGWTLESEPTMSMSGVEIGGLIYMKGDDGAGIIAMSGMGLPGTCYILATGPWSAFGGLEGQGAPPSWMPTVTAQGSGSTVTLTIRNEGGDDVNITDLQVQGSDSTGTMVTATLSPSSGTLSTDGTITATYTYGPSPSGKVITVKIIHDPSKYVYFISSSIVVQPSTIAPPPSVMLTVTARDDPGGVLLTITHHGGDDLPIADLTVKAIRDTTSAENTNIGAGTLNVGYSLQVLVNLSVDPNDVITVFITHVPTQQKLFADASIVVQAGLPPTPPPPTQMLTVRAENIDSTTIKLTISHEGGDDLSLADLKVQGSDSTGTMQTAALSPSSGTLSVGSTCTATYTYGASPSGAVITVYITHVPTGQKIFSSSSVVVR